MAMDLITGESFQDVPKDARGEPMLVARTEGDYQIYIEWLADYLYRPDSEPDEPLSAKDAGLRLITIEVEIADVIWTNPYADYPPEGRLPSNGARHADIFHREAMSKVLSRVPDRSLRLQLIDHFYCELNCDASK